MHHLTSLNRIRSLKKFLVYTDFLLTSTKKLTTSYFQLLRTPVCGYMRIEGKTP